MLRGVQLLKNSKLKVLLWYVWIQRPHANVSVYIYVTYPFHIQALVESFQPDQNLEQHNAIRKQPQDLLITFPKMHAIMS